VHRLALVLVAIVGLSFAAQRRGAAATCQSTCTQQLAACKQTCPNGGQARRDCRAAFAERSTCTAPGARIRTLAYVVTECTTDALGRSSLQQSFLIRRGNGDPVPVMQAGPSTPVPNTSEVCRNFGALRLGLGFLVGPGPRLGVFQNAAVLPDGSGVVFDVTEQLSEIPALTPDPREEGIFFVRADGTGLRSLGPPSRVRPFGGAFRWAASPDGRTIAFIDLGPFDAAGHEAPQVFLLDVRSGERRQLTRQTHVPNIQKADPGIWLPTFLDRRTVGYYSGSTATGTFTAFQVKTDGSHEKELPPFVAASGAQIVSQFGVTGMHPHEVLGLYPGQPAENGSFVREVFLVDRNEILQLTKFDRNDTSTGGEGGRGVIIGDRALFLASSANGGENPHEVCQFFSISTREEHLRQLAHLPWDGLPSPGGCAYPPPGCGIVNVSTAADQFSGTLLFSSSCDPVGANPFGAQIFAMRPDGSGLRQLTKARGMTTEANGTVHVEIAGPFAYPSQKGG
jgi:hypothetical protein